MVYKTMVQGLRGMFRKNANDEVDVTISFYITNGIPDNF